MEDEYIGISTLLQRTKYHARGSDIIFIERMEMYQCEMTSYKVWVFNESQITLASSGFIDQVLCSFSIRLTSKAYGYQNM